MRLQQGISLLEVLLAVLLLKVSVLGALAGQLHARQIVTEATQRTQAAAMAMDWLNRMQAAGYHTTSTPPAPPLCTADEPCSSNQLAAWLHQQWQQHWWQGTFVLAHGGYCIGDDASSLQLTIYWQGRLLQKIPDHELCVAATGLLSLTVQAAL